jgi:hypothetical protein
VMKKLLLSGVAALFLATEAAQAEPKLRNVDLIDFHSLRFQKVRYNGNTRRPC